MLPDYSVTLYPGHTVDPLTRTAADGAIGAQHSLESGAVGSQHNLGSIVGEASNKGVRMAIERSRLVAKPESLGAGDPDVIAALAVRVLINPRIDLSRGHVSGINDGATARQNILSQAFESLAKRSKYENAPGGTLNLDVRVLRALLELSNTYSMSISELAGGSHSKSSTHTETA